MSARPYRILQLTSTAAIGGAEMVALQLARGCDPARFEMHLDSLTGPPLLTEAARRSHPPIPACHWSAPAPWPWQWPRWSEQIHRIRAARYDLIQTYGLRADLVGRLLKRRLGAPRLLCCIHSTDAWRRRPKILLDRWTAGPVDAFVSVTRAGRRIRIEREHLPADKIAWIPNGIEIDPPGLPDRDEARRNLKLPPDAFPVIAHIANLRPMKGHGEIVKAAPRIFEKFPSALILLAGRDESDGRYLHQARQAGLADRIRFLGYHPRPREILRAADLFILPSYYEGAPISILEAMAERCPIVASNVGGIPEQVRHENEAWLIPPRDAAALAEAIFTWPPMNRCAAGWSNPLAAESPPNSAIFA